MNNRALYWAVAFCFTAVGCGQTPPPAAPAKPKVEAAAPMPPAAPPAAPASAAQDATPKGAAPASTKRCDKGDCETKVAIASCTAPGVTPDPWTIEIDTKHKNVRMLWTITTPGYTFAATDGIFFKGPGKEKARGEFTGCKLANKEGTQFECKNKNDDGTGKRREFPYGITVLKDAKPCAVLDPTVVNDA
jgi:hypothetical protein